MPPWRAAAARAAVVLAVIFALAAPAAVHAGNCGVQGGNKLCKAVGECCSKHGWCGAGPKFCGADTCYSGCDGKGQPEPETKLAAAARSGKAQASCSAGNVITAISDACYGSCLRGCNSTSSYRVVASLCLLKAACVVPVWDNSFGGDPCPKLTAPKALSFWYTCDKAPVVKPPVVKPPVIKPPVVKPPVKPPVVKPPAVKPPVVRPPVKPPVVRPPATKPTANFYSSLWGKAGELWKPTGPLCDWSYAGYMGNQKAIPSYQKRFNVKDYGAKGDGKADDTAAIRHAIQLASAAATLMATKPCGYKGANRCLLPHKGFVNEGKLGAVVWLPAGTYRITQTLEIMESNVVLRGAGVGKTRLYFPKGLQAIYGNTRKWATGGGFLMIDGYNAASNNRDYQIGRIIANARKGTKRLVLTSTAGIQVGDWIRIYALATSPYRRSLLAATNSTRPRAAAQPGFLPLTPALERQMESADKYMEEELTPDEIGSAAQAGTLDAYIYGENLVDSGRASFKGTDHIRFPSRVVRRGIDWIELERPLPYDVRVAWNSWVYRFQSTVQHSGIEGMTLEFVHDVYPEHLNTKGYNGIVLNSVSNCWVRGVEVINSDNAVVVTQSDFVSVDGVKIWVTKPRWTASTKGDNGHHALWVGRSGDVSFTNFYINSPYMHDLSVDGFAERTVWANGRGIDMNIDCHRAGPHNHLFSNLDFGLGSRTYHSGGDQGRGAHAGANVTFWGLTHASGKAWADLPDDCGFGPMLNFIGTWLPPKGYPAIKVGQAVARYPRYCAETQWFTEQAGWTLKLYPQDLFAAMVATRKQRLGV